MSDFLSSKIKVTEEAPKMRGVPSAPTSVVAAVGITESGPIDTPVLCNAEKFQEVFGGFTKDSDLALAAKGFFENGGPRLWVVRTAHHGDINDPDSVTAKKAKTELTNEAQTVLTVEAKYPGSYANWIEVEVSESSLGAPGFFDLAVIDDGSYREFYRDMEVNPGSPRDVVAYVNSRSKMIRLIPVDEDRKSPLEVQRRALIEGEDGLDGLDDNDFIGSATGKTGLHALDTIQDLSILIVPGRSTAAVQNAVVQYCEIHRGGMVFGILDPPEGLSAEQMVEHVLRTAGLFELSEHAAVYWPRVKILNPNKSIFGTSETIVVPPSGIIAGVFARTDAARAGGVYDPPAGIENGQLYGVLGFETDEVLDEKKRDLVYPRRINPLTTGEGLPRFIDGSRTLKSSGPFPYIAERRGVTFIERSLKQGLQFARHKNNTESLRAQVRRSIKAFLLTQTRNGAFRSDEPDKAFFVDVSDELNPPSVVFAGRLVARVGLATNKPAEFIELVISQDTRSFEAELAAADL